MAGATKAVPDGIFISYRREDAAYPAGWLFDRVADRFGKEQVFKDVDSIDLGDDFVDVITAAVASCSVLLAVIGRRWMTITDDEGRRRLDKPDDFVRLEIETALARNIRVIPILVERASMPRADQLPASLARLAHRNALEVSPDRFSSDTRRLLKVLERTLAEVQAEDERPQGAVRQRELIRDEDPRLGGPGDVPALVSGRSIPNTSARRPMSEPNIVFQNSDNVKVGSEIY